MDTQDTENNAKYIISTEHYFITRANLNACISEDVIKSWNSKLNQKKAGFSGTLDPLASGLLIIFLNKATKLSSFFLNF